MAETKFTPGPWHVEAPSGANVCFHVQVDVPCLGSDKSFRTELCTLWGNTEDLKKETEANARLMAAAPDLLAALEAAREELRLIRMKDHGTIYNPILGVQIDMALSRARGEG